MSQYLAVFELSGIDGANGFQINGEGASDESGFSVSSAGDVNGDGFDDIIIGAKFADPATVSNCGASYVVFGKASGFGTTFNLSSLDGNNGFRINGEAIKDYSGRSVSDAGDVNGDGFDDFIIGAYGADPHGSYSGAAYLVFGKASGFANPLALSSLDSNNGFQLNGVALDDLGGWSVSSAGDLNGDGFADLVIGAHGADPHGNFSGAAYVVFGGAVKLAALDGNGDGNIDLSNLATLDGANGFTINGEHAYDVCGLSVSSAGDVNRDGFDDLVVGVPGVPYGASFGATYVVYGKGTAFDETLEVSAIDGNNGFRIDGKASRDRSGYSVSDAGDVNGDGYADLIIGAYSANPHGADSGASYVVFGRAHPHATVKLGLLDGNNGFKLNGEAAGNKSGWSVSSAGDFNGDGFDDLIIGSKFHPLNSDPGASYVVFGTGSGFAAALDLSSLDGNNGFRINGEADYDNAGWSVSSAGDFNGDGFADLIVGAPYVGDNGLTSGASYVIFGAKPGEAVTRTGSAIGQTIHGSIFNDTLSGLGGKDVLFGYRGKDVMSGGSGKDTLDGGKGADTFVYTTVSDSTGNTFDIVKHADFAVDLFDITGTVGDIDATVATGTLSNASFDADLAAKVDSGHLAIGHAVLFTPNAGGFAGKTFLIVDQNGVAGYQAGVDLVVRLEAPANLASIDSGDFI